MTAPPPEIFLSCGEFEGPAHAKNLNLPFAMELRERLGVGLHTYPQGHQMEGWSPELEKSLHALPHINFERRPLDSGSKSDSPTNHKAQQYRDALIGMRQSGQGYMATTKTSETKQREKHNPLETTPKPPWKP